MKKTPVHAVIIAYYITLEFMNHVTLSYQGMDIIETLNPTAFTEYLKKYGNTICGRHPIGVLLQVCLLKPFVL